MSNLEESRARVRELLNANPELKKAFKESIEELKKPENIDKMAKQTAEVFSKLQKLRGVNNG